MSESVDALVLDLLEWIGPEAKPYREVIDAWRTSCPRLPVWEEANERGYLTHGVQGSQSMVSVSTVDTRFLAARGRAGSPR